MQECICKTTKDTKQENIKIKQEDLPRTTWRSWRTHEWIFEKMQKFLKHAIDTKLKKIDSRLIQETQNIFDFMIF